MNIFKDRADGVEYGERRRKGGFYVGNEGVGEDCATKPCAEMCRFYETDLVGRAIYALKPTDGGGGEEKAFFTERISGWERFVLRSQDGFIECIF